jgi:hypothetical protein
LRSRTHQSVVNAVAITADESIRTSEISEPNFNPTEFSV